MAEVDLESISKLLEQASNVKNLGNLQSLLDILTQKASGLKDALKQMAVAGEQNTIKFKQIEETLGKVASTSNDLRDKINAIPFGNLLGDLENFKKKGSDASGEMSIFINKIVNTGKSLMSNLLPGLRSVGEGLKENVGLMALNHFSMVRDMVSPMKDFKGFSTGIFSGLNQSLRDNLEVQNLARFNFMSLGKSIGQADAEAEKFPERMRASAMALGLGLEETKKYNDQVRFIPDALKTANAALVNYNYIQDKQITISQLAQVGMKAWGLSTENASNIQQQAYTQLNRSGESMINMLGEMHGAIKEGFMPATMASEQIMKASSSMGIFGSNASLATNIWKQFASSLTAGGVAANEVGNIVNQVTTGIANMSIQNRAFIGMMSGMFQGATALGGGLKMELAMRSPGGLEKNLESLTSSIARFGGGQILTLEQAANNPQLEMQFVLQRQMLGKLAGITNTEQQNRVLETLKGVEQGGISRIDGSRQLNDLMKRGTDVQANTVTSIEKMERALGERISQSNSILSNIQSDLKGFNRLGMGVRGGGLEPTSITETPSLKLGSARALKLAGNMPAAIDATKEGLRGYGTDFRRFSGPARTFQNELNMGSRPIELEKTSANYILEGLMGVDRLSNERLPTGAGDLLPKTQTLAMMPRGMTGINDPNLSVALEKIANSSSNRDIINTSPAVMENIKTTRNIEENVIKQENPNMLVTRTESEIVIKVDSDDKKVHKTIMEVLGEVLPQALNADRRE